MPGSRDRLNVELARDTDEDEGAVMAAADARSNQQARWAAEKAALEALLLRHGTVLEMASPLAECPIGWNALVGELLAALAALDCRRVGGQALHGDDRHRGAPAREERAREAAAGS